MRAPRIAVKPETFTGMLHLVMAFLFIPMAALLLSPRSILPDNPVRHIVSVFTEQLTGAAPGAPNVYDQEKAMSPRDLMGRWDPLIAQAAEKFGVSADWIRAVMRQESGGRTVLADNRPITSGAGAVGIMQVMPGTYEEMRQQLKLGADPYNPRDNIYAGAAYLRWLHGRYGFPGMFAAYNGGPGTYEDHVERGKPLPRETVNYVASVTAMLDARGGHKRARMRA